MKRLTVLLPVLLALQVGAEPALAWTWPVDGPVLQRFSFGADPYAAGQHRGIDVGAPFGAPVAAPAAGVVTFAGSVPGGGRTLTIRTGDGYAVTLVHLGTIEVAAGASVAEGAAVATVGPSGEAEVGTPYVHLGVRVASDGDGYVDPLALLPTRAEAVTPVESLPAAEDGPSATTPTAVDAGAEDGAGEPDLLGAAAAPAVPAAGETAASPTMSQGATAAPPPPPQSAAEAAAVEPAATQAVTAELPQPESEAGTGSAATATPGHDLESSRRPGSDLATPRSASTRPVETPVPHVARRPAAEKAGSRPAGVKSSPRASKMRPAEAAVSWVPLLSVGGRSQATGHPVAAAAARGPGRRPAIVAVGLALLAVVVLAAWRRAGGKAALSERSRAPVGSGSPTAAPGKEALELPAAPRGTLSPAVCQAPGAGRRPIVACGPRGRGRRHGLTPLFKVAFRREPAELRRSAGEAQAGPQSSQAAGVVGERASV